MNVLGPSIILMQLDEITNLTPKPVSVYIYRSNIAAYRFWSLYISKYQHNETKTKPHNNDD